MNNRTQISAFVIAKNEEEHIKACLESLSFCDEILLIDSFSKDRTVEIAESMGARVIQRPWPGYKEQKAFGLKSVTHEWVINLDADERVSEEFRNNILNILERDFDGSLDKNIKAFTVNRTIFHLGKWWRKGGWYPEFRVRFFRKSAVTWGGVDPHEKPIVDGRIEKISGEIEHFTYKNIDEQFARLHNLSTLAAREDFNRGKKSSIFSIIFNPVLRFIKFYFMKKGFLEGKEGLIVAFAEGYYTFMKYAKLWDLQHQKKLLDKA